MTFAQDIIRLPLFGIAYAMAGIAFGSFWLCVSADSVLRALSGVVVAMATLNAYIEGWEPLRRIRPEYAVLVLIILFLLPYAFLSIRLMELQEGMCFRPAVWSSYLPIVCLLFLGLGMALGSQRTTDNLPKMLFVGIALICVLHVPMFAYGKGDVVKAMRNASVRNAGISRLSPDIFRRAVLSLAAPLLVVLVLQSAIGKDWTLLGTDAVTTAAILSLFLA